MANKFDTNPLDPEFPEKVRATQTETLPKSDRKTRKFAEPSASEEQTRPFSGRGFTSYAPPAETGPTPAAFDTNRLQEIDTKAMNSRKVAKIGLPENILVALPYLPFSIGLIASILELVFVPQSEAKVRFHAAQGLAAHIGILIITTILGIAGSVTDLADLGNGLFQLVTTIMLIVFAFKAWKGRPVHIEAVDDLTNWLEEKIKPKK